MANEAITAVPAASVAAEVAAKTAPTAVEAKHAEVKAEAAPEVKATEPKEKDSQRFAMLAKREKELHRKREEFKAREAEVNQKWAQVEAFEKAKASAKTNPLKLLETYGLSYPDLTNFLLNDQQPTPDLAVKALKDEIDGFKKAEEDKQKKAAEDAANARAAAETQILTEFKAEIASTVKAATDDYELINTYGSFNLVYDLIEGFHAQHGKVLTIKEAAEQVEKYLEGELEKSAATKKFQSKYGTAAKVEPQPQGDKKRTDTAQRRTLSNDMTATTPADPVPARTSEERRQRAIARLKAAKA